MGVYIALSAEPHRQQFWKNAEIHLRVIAAFDPGLTVTKGVKTLLGFALKEIKYVPTDLKYEGRKVLHSVINYIGVIRDVIINPLEGMYKYSKPNELAFIKQGIPWVNQNASYFYLSDFGGGLAFPLNNNGEVWGIEYDCQDSLTYKVPAKDGSGFIPLTRPQTLFHELTHVSFNADPLGGPILTYEIREAIVVEKENAFRKSQNPHLLESQLRSRTDPSVFFY